MLKSISIAFFVRGIGATATLLMSIIISQHFPVDEAGYYFLAFTLLSILAPINVFGTDTYSLRFIGSAYAERNWNKIHGYTLITTIITGIFSLATSMILWLSAPLIADNLWQKPAMEQILKQAAIVSILFSFSTLLSFHLQAIHKVIESIIILSIGLPLGISICVLSLNINNTEQIFEWLKTIAILNLILGIFFYLRSTPYITPKFPRLLNLLAICFPLWLVTFIYTLTTWGTQLIAAAWITPEEIAYLSTAQRTANLVSFTLIAVNLVMAPRFAGLYKQDNHEELKKIALKTVKILILTAVPITAIIILYNKKIMSIFGENFTNSGDLLIILAIGQLVNAITGSVGYLLTMTGHEKDMRNIVLITSIITIGLTILVTPIYGVIGAAFSISIGVSIQNLGAVWIVKKRLGFNTLLFWKY